MRGDMGPQGATGNVGDPGAQGPPGAKGRLFYTSQTSNTFTVCLIYFFL